MEFSAICAGIDKIPLISEIENCRTFASAGLLNGKVNSKRFSRSFSADFNFNCGASSTVEHDGGGRGRHKELSRDSNFPECLFNWICGCCELCGREKAGINLITDLCGWRCDFMARELSGKSWRNLSWELEGENYETSEAINCVAEELNFLSVAIHAEREKWKNQTIAPGDHLKLSIPIAQLQITFCIMDHLMSLLLRARK